MMQNADRHPSGVALKWRVRLRSFPIIALALLLAGCEEETGTADAPASEPKIEDRGMIAGSFGREWRRIDSDGLHDPRNDMVAYLQEPAEALTELPPDGPEGNKVDWMAALAKGMIAPRTNIQPETKVRILDLDIVFEDTGGQPHVVFPHRQHTEWLDCSNCHPKIFEARKGANEFGMLDILQGQYCGRCHGAVAFPLTRCARCHSRDRDAGAAQ